VLDPEGAAIPEGPELYFTLMRGLAKGLTECLGG
jgi:zinc transport system substrate-binding protein